MTTQRTNFALIGVAGFIAKRHLQAIKETGNLIASMDKSDSVGILDSYFPDSEFFTEYERFERYIEKNKNTIDYLVVCTPNYLHDTHIRLGLLNDIEVICEKPVTVNPWNLDSLSKMSFMTGNKVNLILQMRLHPEIENIKKLLTGRDEVEIVYNVNRGKWYEHSWKYDPEKSGGLIYNIGIHFLDLMCYLFGRPASVCVGQYDDTFTEGMTIFDNAAVKWTLSINDGVPRRIIRINGEEFDLTNGFENLHTESYRRILEGNGWDIEEARNGIELASRIRKLSETINDKIELRV